MVPVPPTVVRCKVTIALFCKINWAKLVLESVAVTAPVAAVLPPTFVPSNTSISVAASADLDVPVPFKTVFQFELVVKLTGPVPPTQ